jgi:hypothetical protein
MRILDESAGEIMADMALRFFDNRCQVTHEKFKRRGFVIHHIIELEVGEVLRRHYPDGEKGRVIYLKALRPLVEANYNSKDTMRYALIKNGIHTKLDHHIRGVTRLKMENRERFCELALATIHRKSAKQNKQLQQKINRKKRKKTIYRAKPKI